MDIILVERSPTIKEYQTLRKAVGWENVPDDASEIGLRNSLFSVCAVYEDVPEFQRKGIGKCIMDAVMRYLSTHAHSNAFIGLMAAKGVSGFYERYGFIERAPDRPGMFKIWENK